MDSKSAVSVTPAVFPPPPEHAACVNPRELDVLVATDNPPRKGGGAASNFNGFYLSAFAPLRRYLSRLLGCSAEAQDIAQDAFVRVYAVLRKHPLDHPQAYLFTTARRLAIDELRRRRSHPVRHGGEEAFEDVASEAPGVEHIVMARQELEQLMSDIDTLPPGCRTVLLLSRLENLSHQQIADKVGIAYSTVEKQHARALRLLRQTRLEREANQTTTRSESASSPPFMAALATKTR